MRQYILLWSTIIIRQKDNINSRLPTTSRNPVLLDMGSVLTWHIYHPLSVSLVSRIWRHHLRWPLCVTAIRWFFVITWVAIVRIVCVSTRSHATYTTKEQSIFMRSSQLYQEISDDISVFSIINRSELSER